MLRNSVWLSRSLQAWIPSVFLRLLPSHPTKVDSSTATTAELRSNKRSDAGRGDSRSITFYLLFQDAHIEYDNSEVPFFWISQADTMARWSRWFVNLGFDHDVVVKCVGGRGGNSRSIMSAGSNVRFPYRIEILGAFGRLRL
ncbi:uncharacterized protein B0T23DRAFT_372418 [Neurospora hispaniola]|uniref:Uncharacterized protein n=1 Tax=Neurospora hispaniola TaxID=588809 RepID=A0AAJ0IBF8_9PEZI|nr:hypothetical protein B0T23DRAFT_372418 [Neurospora hispaniola]